MHVYKVVASVATSVETDRYGNEEKTTKNLTFFIDAESEYVAMLSVITFLGERGETKGVLEGLACGELTDTVIL
jgi:hypothetical protein